MFTVNASLTYRNVATKKFLVLFPSTPPSMLAAALLALTSGAGLVLVTLLWGASLLLRQPHEYATMAEQFTDHTNNRWAQLGLGALFLVPLFATGG
jgi:hypothetical protein